MLDGMDRNTRVMEKTIANQGRLFISMGMLGFIMGDKELTRREKIKMFLAGMGVLVVADCLINRGVGNGSASKKF